MNGTNALSFEKYERSRKAGARFFMTSAPKDFQAWDWQLPVPFVD
jgi:hypothetical protein